MDLSPSYPHENFKIDYGWWSRLTNSLLRRSMSSSGRCSKFDAGVIGVLRGGLIGIWAWLLCLIGEGDGVVFGCAEIRFFYYRFVICL